jgi:uncharacterized protein (TIGR00297 family)
LNIFLFILFIVGGMAGAVLAKKLTMAAAFTGGFLACLIFIGLGWAGILLMAAFFLLGTWATSWKKNVKQSLGITGENKSGRTTGQVLANGGAGGLMALLAIVFPQQSSLFLYLLAAVFSSATADTVSSELGSVYGSRFYDILSWRKGNRGADGVISAEGTLAGIAGSCIIALLYAIVGEWGRPVIWLVIAGTVGNLADSFMGAVWERKGVIGNDAVNFFNTMVAALTAFLLATI